MMQRERFVRSPDGAAGGAGAGAGAPAGAAAGAAGGAASGDWTTALTPDHRTLVTTKGWKSVGDALTGYAHLERLVGADKIALPGKGANGERDWSAWDGWNALGRPEAADKYDLSGLKLPEGQKLQDDLLKGFLATAHKEGLTQRQALAALQSYVGLEQSRAEAAAAARRQGDEEFNRQVAEKWGAGKEAKLAAARNAASRLGFEPDALDKLEQLVGGFDLLDALADVGGRYFTEDGAGPRGGAGGGGLPGTPAAARAEIDRIMGEAKLAGATHPYLDNKHPEHQALQEKVLRLWGVVGGGSAP